MHLFMCGRARLFLTPAVIATKDTGTYATKIHSFFILFLFERINVSCYLRRPMYGMRGYNVEFKSIFVALAEKIFV